MIPVWSEAINKACDLLVSNVWLRNIMQEILKEFEMFTPNERKKYMIKQQEEFLKSIDSVKLVEKIRKFRALNIKDMEMQEIEEALSEVLTWNGSFCYLTNMGTYSKGTPFFRIRKLKGSSIPNKNLAVYGDFWEPPKSCVKVGGRLNKKGESLLYVTPGDPKVPLKELHIVEGEWYALIKYVALEQVKVNIIGGQYDYSAIGFTDDTAILNNNLINDFLKDEFSRDVGKGTEYLYKISEIIAKWYFDLPPENVQDAWAYSSIQDKEKYNVCFRPEIAHKLLKLEGALICKKEKSDDISVRCIAIGAKAEDKAYFYPLGSEQQKRIFPEILIK